jgi:methylglutaconyl-CoA hydratase
VSDRPPVRTELDDGIFTVILDRVQKKNALNLHAIGLLHDALERADLDATVRVVVMRGAGPDFCAGADLRELLASADASPEDNERDALRLGSLFMRIRALPKVVIAAVTGRALAGGAGLATACDIVLASDSAEFGYPEIQRGFVPAMVMAMLRRLAGEKAAFDLVATGRTIPAEEALRLGLLSRVIPSGEFDAAVTESARRVRDASASALALTKRLFYQLDGLGFDDGIALAARVNAFARATPDFRDAIAGFLRA